MAGCKMNSQKSIVFFMNKNKQEAKEIKEVTPSLNTSKRIRYLGINLIKKEKDLYICELQDVSEGFNNRGNKTICLWRKRL